MSASIASKLPALLCAGLLLCACGGKPADDASQPGVSGIALPEPEPGSGSVTGMSAQPGPGDVPLAGEPPPQVQDRSDLFNPESGFLPSAAPAAEVATSTTAMEPTVQDALTVIRDYYASIDGGSFARAYALWADGGRASRQTPGQFANGFADTAHVAVAIGTPGDEEAGAGQRYLQVPVTVTATRNDGSVHRLIGQYTLHRSVVDGASADQRAWRIASAELGEVKPGRP